MPAKAGQIKVTTTGTAVVGTSAVGSLFSICAHPDNTDTVWVGNDGAASPDVSATTGYPLTAQSGNIVMALNNLNELWFDADVSGEKICWILLE